MGQGVRKMPRPRTLKNPKTVTIIFEKDDYEELERIAFSKNTSVSALLRELVSKYIESELTEKVLHEL
jgi:predicted CopG family antitoxin